MTRDTSRRRERRGRGGIKQVPWRRYRNPYKPIEVLSADQIEAIHDSSLKVLEEIGMDFLDEDSLAILKAAGAEVAPGTQRVRFPRGLVLESVAKAPAEITLHARNPEHSLTVGGNHLNFGSVASAPNVSDLDKGRRPGSFEDYCNLVRLCQSLNIVQFISGYPVEPADLPPATRHLDSHYAAITLTDKIWHPYSLGKQRISDAIDMICIARGIDRETLRREPSLFSIVNSSSPLRLDGPMLQGLMEMARHGQCVVLTPFTLSGAMSPATIAGALSGGPLKVGSPSSSTSPTLAWKISPLSSTRRSPAPSPTHSAAGWYSIRRTSRRSGQTRFSVACRTHGTDSKASLPRARSVVKKLPASLGAAFARMVEALLRVTSPSTWMASSEKYGARATQLSSSNASATPASA